MPPFELPGKAMVSGMKSNSTPGGGGYNEISLDDTKGSEKIIVHGQYDMRPDHRARRDDAGEEQPHRVASDVNENSRRSART